MVHLKSTLAVALTAAVVFAPGSGGSSYAGSSSASDIGARMLAPTFDEATERTIGSVHKRSDGERSGELKLFSGTSRGWPAVPFALLLLVLSVAAFARPPGTRRPPSGRAPPHVLTP